MIDKQRAAVVAKIKRMEDAISRSKSKNLINDYTKVINHLKRELADYDRFRGCVNERNNNRNGNAI